MNNEFDEEALVAVQPTPGVFVQCEEDAVLVDLDAIHPPFNSMEYYGAMPPSRPPMSGPEPVVKVDDGKEECTVRDMEPGS